ncbi:MAG: Gfo/Idh/MocA family oxidoreductase [Planctomycetes bacterium]|jgi:predicted dehydrogenase|nr:Gfo/Idh/MocA family oxidoreductase [Planctomycetota bacterium]
MVRHTHVTRRNFLRTTTGAALGAIGLPYVVRSTALGRSGAVAASERIAVGCVGTGPQGTAVMRNFLNQKDGRVIAICDLKAPVREATQKLVNDYYKDTGCAVHTDYRELIARPDIDVVSIATCDHWHVLVALEAARAGKDMYLEKPMGLSLAEDQALRAACRQYGTRFQFGTQQRSSRNFRFACELVKNKRIGELKTINVWSPGSSSGGPRNPAQPPAWIDYDRWLGPAPYHAYTPGRESNSWWWFISDYALGFIAGWGVHPLDIALWGLGDKLPGPLTIEGKGQWPDPNGVCDTAMNWNVTGKFDNGVTMNFTGAPFPEEWKQRYGRTTDHGTAFEGTDGWVHVDRSGINAHPKELLETQWGPSDMRLYESGNHARNLLDCVRTRQDTICPIDVAVQADTLCQISDIAIRLEQKLRWDPAREQFVNNDAANRRLVRAMRSPWRL